MGSATASAADCEKAYTTDQLLGDLVTMEDFLRSTDDGAAGVAAAAFEKNLGCLDEVLPPMITGRVYRAVAGGLHVVQPDRARGWFMTALEVDPTFTYGVEDLSATHPVRLAYEKYKGESQGTAVAAGDKTFGEGKHWLDGRKIDAPAARAGRPHLFQLESEGVKSWIIEGNAFPDEVLTAAVAVVDPGDGKKPKPPKGGGDAGKPEKPAKTPKVKTPKGKPVEAGGDGVMMIERDRPPEKTPLMIAGIATMLGAGGLYFYSTRTLNDFNGARNEGELDKYYKLTNAMVVASGAVFAVGAGTLSWGIIIDGKTPIPAIRIRF